MAETLGVIASAAFLKIPAYSSDHNMQPAAFDRNSVTQSSLNRNPFRIQQKTPHAVLHGTWFTDYAPTVETLV